MNKRIKFGRRKSDWIIPLGFLTVGVIAAFWASYNRTKKTDIERQKEALEVQVKLLERVVDHYEKGETANATRTGTDKAVVPAKATKANNALQAENSAQPDNNAAAEKSSSSDRMAPAGKAPPTVTISNAPTAKPAPTGISTPATNPTAPTR